MTTALRTFSGLASIALACALFASAAPALAEPTAAERETARSLMDDADRLHAAGDTWGALERYQAADQIMHAPTTALELARVQAELLQLVEARASAISAATSQPSPGEARAFGVARKAAAKLAEELAPRVPDVTVFTTPAVADLHVSIDGTALPRLSRPLPFKLNPGAHLLEIEASGYAAWSQQFSLSESQRAELHVELKPLRPTAATVTLRASEPEPQPAAVDLAVHDDPNAAGRTRGYVALIAGGVIFAVGAVTGIVSATKTSSIHAACGGYSCPLSKHSELVTAYTLANVANVTIPLGLLGVGYGVFELLTHGDAPAQHPESARLSWSVSVDKPGVWVRGAL